MQAASCLKLPQLGDVQSNENWLNEEATFHIVLAMPGAYDLILEQEDGLTTRTVIVADAPEAWRLGMNLYPDQLRGVVCRDIDQAVPDRDR